MVINRGFGQIMEEGDSLGFFKILRSEDLSSEVTRGIPLNFMRNITEKDFSDKMVLKVSWGNSWSWTIKIYTNSVFYFMEKNGWEKFLSDNGLGNNEFLTFTHKGHLCFSVDIYQIDCLEMLRPRKSAAFASSSSSCRENQREERKNIYTGMKKQNIESSSKSRHPVPKTADESTERSQRLSMISKKAEEIENTKKKKKTKVETVCNNSEDEAISLVPQLTISIKKSYLLFLGIPKRFEIHMPKKNTMFTIHHANGNKSWEVMYVINSGQSRFSCGWLHLAKDLALAVGDVCLLKLIKPNEMLLKVYRKVTP